jgi:hypothetical protein
VTGDGVVGDTETDFFMRLVVSDLFFVFCNAGRRAAAAGRTCNLCLSLCAHMCVRVKGLCRSYAS